MRMLITTGLALTLGVAGISGIAGTSAKTVKPADVKIADIKIADIKIVSGAVAQALTGKPDDPEKGRRWFMGRQRGNCPARHITSDHVTSGHVTSGHTTSREGAAKTVLKVQQGEDVIACLMTLKEEYRWSAMDGIYSMQSDDKRRNTNADDTA